MSINRHCRYLSQDVHFFAAALSGALISVWEEDPAGVYIEAEKGFVDRYTSDYVRIRNVETGVRTHYSRDTAMFERI
ncbi:hypothetical protein CPT76_36235 [Paenibacillus sp. AR247]|nr:hypothetical protein CPT76_36235 [Paenibacillus sp. AR247]